MSDKLTKNDFVNEVSNLIDEARMRVAGVINAELSLLYLNIGKSINREVLQGKRADYGKEVIKSLAEFLTQKYGKGWSEKQLRHCLRTAETFPDDEVFSALRRELSWTHIKTLTYIDDELKRDFYIEICKLENWTSRQLQDRIRSMLYERTALSKKPEETIKNDLNLLKDENKLSPELVFRDPYLLDFLGLSDTYSEKDLESAILAELQRFIVEMGNDFAFLPVKNVSR